MTNTNEKTTFILEANEDEELTFIIEANEDYIGSAEFQEALQNEFHIEEISVENLGGAFEVKMYSYLNKDDTLRKIQEVADELVRQNQEIPEPDFGEPYAGRGYSSLGEAEELRTRRKTHI